VLEIEAQKQLRDFDLDVKFQVRDGEILMLVGENGCGKTTVLNLVAGLLPPDSGEIYLGGETLFSSNFEVNLSPESRNIGYVFQSYALFPHMTVYENVAFGLKTRKLSKRDIDDRVNGFLEASGLWDVRSEKAVNISGGQRQRVALARALVIEPDLLLFDEPLAALDTRMQAHMRRELRDLIHDCAVPSIIVTHDLKDVYAIGDRVCLIEGGKIAFDGMAKVPLSEEDGAPLLNDTFLKSWESEGDLWSWSRSPESRAQKGNE